MHTRYVGLALLLVLPTACREEPPPADFTPDAMTFPSRSLGAKDHYFDKAISMCRQAANPDDPDCALRVKGNRDKCMTSAVPAVFQTKIEYDNWTARYLKCLGAP